MKADDSGSILNRARVWFARYRFYSAGRIPRGAEGWARSQLTSGRWMRIHLLFELCWLVVFVAVMLAVAGDELPLAVWAAVAVGAALTPFSAARSRNRALRALADPPAHEVLKRIGEPAPPRY